MKEATTFPITLRAHNPAPFPIRLTFESLTSGVSGGGGVGGGGGAGDGWRPIPGATGWGDVASTAASGSASVASQGTVVAGAGTSSSSSARVPLPPRSLPPGRAWLWTGPVKRTVTIAAGDTEALPLRIAAYFPGTFVLGDYRVTWEPSSGCGVGGGGDGDSNGGSVKEGGTDGMLSLKREEMATAAGKSVGHPSRACNAPFIVCVNE